MTAAMEGLARLVTGRRSAWAVIAGWVVVLAVAVPLAAGLGAEQRNNPVSYLPAGAQSTALLNELAGFPGGDTAAAVVGYIRSGGLTSADRARISAARKAVPAQSGTRRGPVRSRALPTALGRCSPWSYPATTRPSTLPCRSYASWYAAAGDRQRTA